LRWLIKPFAGCASTREVQIHTLARPADPTIYPPGQGWFRSRQSVGRPALGGSSSSRGEKISLAVCVLFNENRMRLVSHREEIRGLPAPHLSAARAYLQSGHLCSGSFKFQARGGLSTAFLALIFLKISKKYWLCPFDAAAFFQIINEDFKQYLEHYH
jgi:hypothetical protein